MPRNGRIRWAHDGSPAAASAVLFDMDGVVTLNSHFHAQAWQQCVQEDLGLPFDLNDPRIQGGRNADILASLTGKPATPEEVRACEFAKENHYRSLAKGHLRPVPGLNDYLHRLTGAQIPIALVTSAGPENMAFVLGELGSMETFQAIVSEADVTNGKPHPEPFQQAASALGIDPAECLTHEDVPSGVRSALDAGCRMVALSTTVSSQQLIETGAKHHVADFDEWLTQCRIKPEWEVTP